MNSLAGGPGHARRAGLGNNQLNAGNASAATITIDSGGTLTSSGTSQFAQGATVNLINGGLNFGGDATFSTGATLTQTGGSLTIAPNSKFNVNGGSVALRLRRASTLRVGYQVASEVFRGKEFGTSGGSASLSTQLVKQFRVQASFGLGDAIYYADDPYAGRRVTGALTLVYQPAEQWAETLTVSYARMTRTSDSSRLYDYAIARSRTTFQVNRFLFFRGILEYNSFRRQLVTDLLASFTYIPGTVLHGGYGSLYDRSRWDGREYVRDNQFLETRRGLFLKASYLWRM
jgi:hypothetical protein